MKTLEEEPMLEVECPCGKVVVITRDLKTQEPASLLHELPMCQEYRDLGPADFLRWLRGKREGKLDA